MKTYNLDQFTYNEETKTFSVEASDLKLPVGQFPLDFEIIHPESNEGCVFEFNMPHHNTEGELMYVTYMGVLAGAVPLKAIIFND